jgi:hypothetical protein
MLRAEVGMRVSCANKASAADITRLIIPFALLGGRMDTPS